VLIHDASVEPHDSEHFHSLFQVPRESQLMLLRCFMALIYFPTDTRQLLKRETPFTDALIRYRSAPHFRTIQGTPPARALADMVDSPLLVLLVNSAIPKWIAELSAKRPLVVLSPDERTLDQCKGLTGITFSRDENGEPASSRLSAPQPRRTWRSIPASIPWSPSDESGWRVGSSRLFESRFSKYAAGRP
jgi:hypothetical protein